MLCSSLALLNFQITRAYTHFRSWTLRKLLKQASKNIRYVEKLELNSHLSSVSSNKLLNIFFLSVYYECRVMNFNWYTIEQLYARFRYKNSERSKIILKIGNLFKSCFLDSKFLVFSKIDMRPRKKKRSETASQALTENIFDHNRETPSKSLIQISSNHLHSNFWLPLTIVSLENV